MKQVLTFVIVVAICMTFVCNAADEPRGQPTEKCDKWESVLSNEKEITVLLVQEGCSGPSNGMRVAIDIALSDGTRTTIFRYQDASWNANYYNQTTPSVKWVGEHRLRISIGAVAAIEKKLETIGAVNVEYDIGHVLYK
jgi:hypothetical protein